jgi:hypothetical protein
MLFFLILLGTLTLITGALAINFYSQARNTHNLNRAVDIENAKLKQMNESLKVKAGDLLKDITNGKNELNLINQSLNNSKELSQDALKSYYKILDEEYQKKEEEYNEHLKILQDAYESKQSEILQALADEAAELEKIQATRVAAIEANLREKKIEEDLSFYCLQIKETELTDIGILESIKPKLNNPRILSMLIWQTYWQKPMTALCNQVIGTAIKSGIYKITNIKTKECYIGQAVDIAARWKQHAKCGLGIDTPPANKLYKAIQEYGIWNFSWEVLEECSTKDLNEKEKYYIEAYKSKEYGYNSISGNKTKGGAS